MNIYEYGNKDSNNILIQPVTDQGLNIISNEVNAINEYMDDYHLLAVKIDDWNKDLSPWEAPAVFGDESFGCGAFSTFSKIINLCTDNTKDYYIGGYLATIYVDKIPLTKYNMTKGNVTKLTKVIYFIGGICHGIL